MIDIYWDDKYTVGNEKIDNEHKVFIDLIKTCSEAIETDRDVDYVSRFLEELVLYAKFHFFSEETLMINSAYTEYKTHREEHERLLATLRAKIFEFRDGPESGEELVEFLFRWFVDHTTSVDKRLANHLEQLPQPPRIKTA